MEKVFKSSSPNCWISIQMSACKEGWQIFEIYSHLEVAVLSEIAVVPLVGNVCIHAMWHVWVLGCLIPWQWLCNNASRSSFSCFLWKIEWVRYRLTFLVDGLLVVMVDVIVLVQLVWDSESKGGIQSWTSELEFWLLVWRFQWFGPCGFIWEGGCFWRLSWLQGNPNMLLVARCHCCC